MRGSAAPAVPYPSYPAFRFRGGRAGRKVKFLVIGGLAVVGAIESASWVKAWWVKSSDDGRKQKGN